MRPAKRRKTTGARFVIPPAPTPPSGYVFRPKYGLPDPDDLDELFGGGPAGYPVEPADGSIVVGGYPFRWRLIDPVTQEEHGPWAFHAEPCAFLVGDHVFI